MEFETSHQENQAGSRKKHSMVQGLPWPFMGLIMVLVLIMLLVGDGQYDCHAWSIQYSSSSYCMIGLARDCL